MTYFMTIMTYSHNRLAPFGYKIRTMCKVIVKVYTYANTQGQQLEEPGKPEIWSE